MSLRLLTSVLASALYLLSNVSAGQAQEVSRRAFTKFGFASCPSSGTCVVDFGTVPGNRAYEIRFVSCYASIQNLNGEVLYWHLVAYNGAGNTGRIHLRPTPLGRSFDSRTFNGTETGLLRVPSGDNLVVIIARDSSTAGGIPNMDCTISGDTIRLS